MLGLKLIHVSKRGPGITGITECPVLTVLCSRLSFYCLIKSTICFRYILRPDWDSVMGSILYSVGDSMMGCILYSVGDSIMRFFFTIVLMSWWRHEMATCSHHMFSSYSLLCLGQCGVYSPSSFLCWGQCDAFLLSLSALGICTSFILANSNYWLVCMLVNKADFDILENVKQRGLIFFLDERLLLEHSNDISFRLFTRPRLALKYLDAWMAEAIILRIHLTWIWVLTI